MRNLLMLLVLGIGLGAVGEARAQSTFTLCNNGEDKFHIATIWQSAFFYPFDTEWTASGWLTLEPGCKELIRTAGRTEAFLSILRTKGEESTIMHFDIKSQAVIESQETLSTGAERFFCVSNDAFTRRTVVLDDHEHCPEGYYLQLFSLYVAVAGDTNFTSDLD